MDWSGAILFQAAWFACVLGAAHGYPWSGPLAVAGVLVVRMVRAPHAYLESRVVLASAILGTMADSAFLASGLVHYQGGPPLPGGVPLWIAALWVNFGAVLNGPLRPLQRRPLAALALGAAGGPLAYLGGEALGALSIGGAGLAAAAVAYALLVPALLTLARALPDPRREAAA